MAAPKAYDIRKVKLVLDWVGTPTGEGAGLALGEVTDLAPDGFGITPTAEATIIEGLVGAIGINLDPTDAAEATITLKSTSEWNSKLAKVWKEQMTGSHIPIKLEVIPDPGYEHLFGFSSLKIAQAYITKFPEWATDEKEAPNVEWTLIGWGFDVTPIP